MLKTLALSIMLLFMTTACTDAGIAASDIIRDDGKVFIVDRNGYKWDVTQAESLGFKAGRFQYGIGRNAFTTLDDSILKDSSGSEPDRMRVIGISEGNESKAFSVSKLSRHEIANTSLAKANVVIGY